MQLKDTIILITGSASTLGRAIAMEVVQRGAIPIVHYHTSESNAHETAELVAEVTTTPLIVKGDISQKSDWEHIRDTINAEYGKLDVLVNNAAVFYRTPLHEVTTEDWDRFIDVNLRGAFLGSQVIGDVMMAQGHGKIINIADIGAQLSWSGYIPYSISKSGLLSLTRGLARALAPNVSVNSISPGIINPVDGLDSSQQKQLLDKIPLGRFAEAEEVAVVVSFLIEAGDYMTGVNINVDGGRTLNP